MEIGIAAWCFSVRVQVFKWPRFLLLNKSKLPILVKGWVWVSMFLEGHRNILHGTANCACSQSSMRCSQKPCFLDSQGKCSNDGMSLPSCEVFEVVDVIDSIRFQVFFQAQCHTRACFSCVPRRTAHLGATWAATQSATRWFSWAVVESLSEREPVMGKVCDLS